MVNYGIFSISHNRWQELATGLVGNEVQWERRSRGWRRPQKVGPVGVPVDLRPHPFTKFIPESKLTAVLT